MPEHPADARVAFADRSHHGTLLREAAVSLARDLGRNLQGDRIETLFVAFGIVTD